MCVGVRVARPLGMRLALLLVLFAGCFIDHGHRCEPVATGLVVPAPLRNPDNLTCQSFGPPCDPTCGLCPATGADIAPIPSWGVCGSSCDSLDQATCAARSDCRVALDLRCAVAGNCATDFVGCFATDMAIDPSVDCLHATTGDSCSRSPACTAFDRNDANCAVGAADCPR